MVMVLNTILFESVEMTIENMLIRQSFHIIAEKIFLNHGIEIHAVIPIKFCRSR